MRDDQTWKGPPLIHVRRQDNQSSWPRLVELGDSSAEFLCHALAVAEPGEGTLVGHCWTSRELPSRSSARR